MHADSGANGCECGWPDRPCIIRADGGDPAAALVCDERDCPVFFYDFNMPPCGPHDTYRVYPREPVFLQPGDRIVFGCRDDGVEAFGHVVSIEDGRLTVAFGGWLPDA